MKNKPKKLPKFFKKLFWWCDFSKIDPEKAKNLVVVQTINYGDLKHWKWLIKYYKPQRLKKIIQEIPQSEFRKSAFKLICLFLNIKETKYETRSAKIRAKKNLRKIKKFS